ncbi:MAG: alcohol dehydrogenase catalytic domain-containing protein [Candidatus Eremiobacteraeota bacterium]|nr:alcohol dehydrogenase catalytic domain-containing protein [Candidatus Eremiobacteraeota bacterium]MCW5868546.1 alcohol dehydrogenase catalytic domain-containing protein [Candidatus Eremiobacteraeota bacterium]
MPDNFGWKIFQKAPLWASRPWSELPAGWAGLQLELAGVCGTDLQMICGYADFEGFLGHEFVARVTESDRPDWLGRRVVGEINVGCRLCPDCRAGDQRFCPARTVLGIRGLDGCFAERFRLPLANLHPVADLEPELAVWCEPLAAALEVGPQLSAGLEVLVLGDGRLGSLIGLALRDQHRVTVAGRHPAKLERLRALGLETTQGVSGLWPVVVEATGTAEGAQQALRCCRPRGTVVLKSTVAESGGLDTNLMVVNALRLVGSRCGPFEPALQALRNGRIDPRPLIDQVVDLSEFPKALEARGFKTLLRGPAG